MAAGILQRRQYAAVIDLQNELPLSLREATKLPQLRRNGRKPDLSSLHRWCGSGVKNIVLESIVVGGTRCTTSEAVDRWIDRLTRQANGETAEQAAATRTPVRRQRESNKAGEELAAAGW